MNEIGFVCEFLANLGPLIRTNKDAEDITSKQFSGPYNDWKSPQIWEKTL